MQWYHSFEFPDGETIEGKIPLKALQHKWDNMHLPDLKDKEVLDIGCWDGWYSFKCAEQGARVYSMDKQDWRLDGWNPYCYAKNKFSYEFDNVSKLECDLFDLEKTLDEVFGYWPMIFDVTLFLGVLYHLKNPLEALKICYNVTRELLVVESHIEVNDGPPYMKFLPGKELNNDPTNWWAPNITCLHDMLKTVGFNEVKMVAQYNTRAIFQAYK